MAGGETDAPGPRCVTRCILCEGIDTPLGRERRRKPDGACLGLVNSPLLFRPNGIAIDIDLVPYFSRALSCFRRLYKKCPKSPKTSRNLRLFYLNSYSACGVRDKLSSFSSSAAALALVLRAELFVGLGARVGDEADAESYIFWISARPKAINFLFRII